MVVAKGRSGEWMSSGLQRQARCAENSDVGRLSRRSLLILALVGALLAAAFAIWEVRRGHGELGYQVSQPLPVDVACQPTPDTTCGGPTMGTAAAGPSTEDLVVWSRFETGNKLTASGRGESTHGLDGRSGSRSKSRDSLMLGASWPHTTLDPIAT